MPLREYIQHNFWWKVASAICAMLIWFTIDSSIRGKVVSSDDDRVVSGRTLTFPLLITVEKAAADSRGYIVTPPEAEVTVRGEAAALDKLRKTDVRVLVNLVDVKEARGLKKKVFVHTPTNVTLVSVIPEEVVVERVVAPPQEQKQE